MEKRRDVYQAIADPTRRAIIQMIAAEPLDIKSLTAKFDMSQQAISLHVKLLADCGLVRMEQRGRNRYCQPKLDKLGEVAEKFLKKGSKIYVEGALQTRKWTEISTVRRST